MQLESWLFGKQVKALPFVLSLSKDERESRAGRRSCFDRLSTNGLSCRQDFLDWLSVYFCLTTYNFKKPKRLINAGVFDFVIEYESLSFKVIQSV